MAVKVDESKCDGCKKCVEVCPVEAIKVETKASINTEECIECGACVNECPQGALSLPE